MTENVIFYFLAAISILSAVFVVTSRNSTYGVLSLVITMFSLAGLFATLGAHFVAMIQIMIYAGAILVLFLFILMLLGMESSSESEEVRSKLKLSIRFILATAFMAEIGLLLGASKNDLSGNSPGFAGTVEAIGRILFHEHLFSFELISLVLLVGVIGVVNLTKKENAK